MRHRSLMIGYVSDVLEDALVYSEHGGKSRVDVDDVRLAIQARVNFSFTGPPPREVCCLMEMPTQGLTALWNSAAYDPLQFMMDLAAKRNTASLPSIPQRMGVRMPPERYCLSSVNFQVDTVCAWSPYCRDVAGSASNRSSRLFSVARCPRLSL